MYKLLFEFSADGMEIEVKEFFNHTDGGSIVRRVAEGIRKLLPDDTRRVMGSIYFYVSVQDYWLPVCNWEVGSFNVEEWDKALKETFDERTSNEVQTGI